MIVPLRDDLDLQGAGTHGARGLEARPDRVRPGGVFPLGHLEGDIDILGRIVPGGADALDHGGETILIPIDPLRQIGDHGEIAVVEADRTGILACGPPLLVGAGAQLPRLPGVSA